MHEQDERVFSDNYIFFAPSYKNLLLMLTDSANSKDLQIQLVKNCCSIVLEQFVFFYTVA